MISVIPTILSDVSFYCFSTISLWSIAKKKPVFTYPLAHGLDPLVVSSEPAHPNPRWITSLYALPYSDLFASGSWNGYIKLWKLSEDIKSFSLIGEIAAVGVINTLQLIQLPKKKTSTQQGKSKKSVSDSVRGVLVIAALGQEHKFGRWKKITDAKNVALVASFDEVGALNNVL